jgi:hypothetical protein
LTLWQQPDGQGNPVWAHSAATSLDKQHALSSLEWDGLNPQGFATNSAPADRALYVQLMASGETLILGTNAFPADRNFAGVLEVAVDSSSQAASFGVVVWSRTSSAEGLYEIGGQTISGNLRLVQLNDHDIFTGPFSSVSYGPPARCLTCVSFTGTLAIIAGSGADHIYADPRIGVTNVFTNEGDDTFNIFGIDHLGSLTIDAGSGALTRRTSAQAAVFSPCKGRCCSMAATAPTRCMCAWTARPTRSTARSCFRRRAATARSPVSRADVSFHCDTFLNAYPSWLDVHAGPRPTRSRSTDCSALKRISTAPTAKTR